LSDPDVAYSGQSKCISDSAVLKAGHDAPVVAANARQGKINEEVQFRT
jgi:hypothetical protein